MTMTFAQQELLNRKTELKDLILKNITSLRAHGVSLNEIATNAGVSRRVLLSLRKHFIHEVSYDIMYVIAVSMGLTVTISLPRLVRA